MADLQPAAVQGSCDPRAQEAESRVNEQHRRGLEHRVDLSRGVRRVIDDVRRLAHELVSQ